MAHICRFQISVALEVTPQSLPIEILFPRRMSADCDLRPAWSSHKVLHLFSHTLYFQYTHFSKASNFFCSYIFSGSEISPRKRVDSYLFSEIYE